MKHDVEAAFAASELADLYDKNQKNMFKVFKRPGTWIMTAGASPDRNWPYPDGMISASNGKKADVQVALEYKRPNEGVHGVLTALGQAFAYISKGYQGTAIVIPNSYPACKDPAKQIMQFINAANTNAPIGVYTYNSSIKRAGTTTFKGNLKEERPLKFSTGKVKSIAGASKDSTIWVHFREGSSEFDDVYKYCLTAKQLDESAAEKLSDYKLPKKLTSAVKRLGIADVHAYLSSSVSSPTPKNRIWRAYWFSYMATTGVLQLYDKKGKTYYVHSENSKVKTWQGNNRTFFTQAKKRIVAKLNSGSITEDDAWEEFAKNIKSRAHSYRIDIEAFVYGIGFTSQDGRLSQLGYIYVNSSKGDAFDDITKRIFAGACLNNGNINVFLQFLHSVTEEKLKNNSLEWATAKLDSKGNVIGYLFDDKKYCSDVEDEFKNLHIIKKVSKRTGTRRPPLKAELTLLKQIGVTDGKYRVGAGLPIEWSEVQAINDYYNSNKFYDLDT